MTSNYKELLNKLNTKDEQIIIDKKKRKVEEFYKQKKLQGNVDALNPEMIKDIDSFNNFITKPATPDACIVLRKTMLHHLNEASPDQELTLKSYIEHFECS